jgi:predicted Rossmann fold flavoprotein
MSEAADIVIIGGGAAGLTAAIFAGEAAGPSGRILLLEGTHALGTKILVSGGGRCNVTHEKVGPEDFNGSRNIVRNILAAFPAEATVQWFASLGVELKREETGKLFPVSDSARTVVDALTNRCKELGVTIRHNARVTGIEPPTPPDDCFQILHPSGAVRAPKVILCTGGKSLPKSGSDGLGWEMVRKLGHTVTSTHQALTPLVLEASMFHADLSGITQEVELSTFAEGKRIDHRRGSLLWTHFGISGPVAMDASRHWIIAQDAGRKPELRCNLLPGESFETVEKWLTEAGTARPKSSILTIISDRLPERVALALIVKAGITATRPVGQLPRDARRALVHTLTALVLPVTQPRGWNYAEVTAGGVPLNEIDYRTMASRKIPGLYLAGEILDCDGRIGGFNFQWAWSTAHLAGKSAAKASVARQV